MAALVETNDHLIMFNGESGTGKSTSLMNIKGNVLYLCCDAGKKLPFKNDFKQTNITDPYQVWKAFDFVAKEENEDKYDVIVIDTLTFLLNMVESKCVIGADDTFKGWELYAEFYRTLMQKKIAKCKLPVIVLAHTVTKTDEKMIDRVSVPIKGNIKNNGGVEAYFTSILASKKVSIEELEPYSSDLLNITEMDKAKGFKYVFQTDLTAATRGEKIRNPIGLFSPNELYIDNDAQKVIDRLIEYYK